MNIIKAVFNDHILKNIYSKPATFSRILHYIAAHYFSKYQDYRFSPGANDYTRGETLWRCRDLQEHSNLSILLTFILVTLISVMPIEYALAKRSQKNTQLNTQQPLLATADSETNPAFALPPWGDGQWGSSEHYGTVMTADLDGDGTAELLGRSNDGLQAWAFDTETGQWKPLYVGGQLGWTDAAGWEKRSWYETIGVADIDGDGADEIFARTTTGIEIYGFDKSNKTWLEFPKLPQFTDAQNWKQPEYYTTIQAADLNCDGNDEIFGRGASGLHIYSFNNIWTFWALQEFSDSQGWNKPQFYSTIQTADIDGDGCVEVFGRAVKGLTVYGWDKNSDSWVHEATDGPYTDAQGWNKERFYTTIGTADVNGDGLHEVYGRGARNVSFYQFKDPNKQKLKGNWTKLQKLSEFTDPGGWNKARFYSTIQAADIDGDGCDELIGRGANGMQVWELEEDPTADGVCSSTTWVNKQLVSGPGFTDPLGWNKASRYSTIQTADIDNDGIDELLGRGPSGIQTYRFDTQSGGWASPSLATFPAFSGLAQTAYNDINIHLFVSDVRSVYATSDSDKLFSMLLSLGNMAQPQDIPLSTWQQVQGQIQQELQWASNIAQMIESSIDLINNSTLVDGLDATAYYLNENNNLSNDAKIIADVVQLFAGIADAASNLAAPEFQVVFGTIDAIASVAFSGQNTSSTFTGTYTELKGKMEANWGYETIAQNNAKQLLMTDYGLLKAVGSLYVDKTWLQLTDDVKEQSVVLAVRANSIWVWQVISLILPNPCNDFSSCIGWGIGICYDNCLYTVNSNHKYDLFNYTQFQQGQINIPKHLNNQMFKATSDSCLNGWDPVSCDYEISKRDVFLGRKGWNYTCYKYETVGSALVPFKCGNTLPDEAAKYGSP